VTGSILGTVTDAHGDLKSRLPNERNAAMATFYEEITDKQFEFIQEQHIFFVATAHKDSRINLSPKGMDTFRVLDNHTVAYLDLTGSGIETAAHLQHNGRVTFMFTSFTQKPNALRLYGTGRAVRSDNPEFDALMQHFTPSAAQRHIITATITSTQDSCGYSVPRYEFLQHRNTLVDYAKKYTPEQLEKRHAERTASIDGLTLA